MGDWCVMAGEDCKHTMNRIMDEAMPEEHIAQLPQISPPNGEGFMHHRLQQAFHPGVFEQQSTIEHRGIGHPMQTGDGHHSPRPAGTQPMAMLPGSPLAAPMSLKDRSRPSLLDMTEDERVRRRREINRNSQRRIRERRMKELEELRTETTRLHQENDQLLRQVECVTAEKAELLRQIQEITEKWQQSIAENAVLNRENLQLRSSLQQMTGIPSVVTGSIAGGVPSQEMPQMMKQSAEKDDQQPPPASWKQEQSG
ncbi:hypothetical protein BSKO_04429 [Bryopsis sp. KO-2023]|nr:hypothetical protein BSKO_04429 [Bryopsis sp. KO-2023]